MSAMPADDRAVSSRATSLSKISLMRLSVCISVAALGAMFVPVGVAAHAQASGAARTQHAVQAPDELSALLTDPLGSRAASGSVLVNGTMVRITWTGDQGRAVRMWSLRRGTCVRDQGMVGAASAYAPIQLNESGDGSSTATLEAAPAMGGDFHVVVHGASIDTTAAPLGCGNLRVFEAPMRPVSLSIASPNGSRPAPAAQATVDHSMMDHSRMAMPASIAPASAVAGAPMPATILPGMRVPTKTDSSLMAIYRRMMEDPVIRERVRTDPVVQRLLSGMPNTDMALPDMPVAPSASASRRTAAGPARKSAVKRAATPARKPAAKPPAAMPGMDHSTMPGMRKPPA